MGLTMVHLCGWNLQSVISSGFHIPCSTTLRIYAHKQTILASAVDLFDAIFLDFFDWPTDSLKPAHCAFVFSSPVHLLNTWALISTFILAVYISLVGKLLTCRSACFSKNEKWTLHSFSLCVLRRARAGISESYRSPLRKCLASTIFFTFERQPSLATGLQQ